MVRNLRFKPSSCLNFQKLCMQLLGFWVYEGPFYIFYFFYKQIIYAMISYLYAATMLMNIVKVWGNMAEMADGLYIVVTVLNIVFKVGALNVKKLKNVMEMLDSDALNVQTENQDIFVKKSMKVAHDNGLAFFIISAAVCWSWNLVPLLTGAYPIKKLPIKAWFPFPYRVSPYYEFAYLFQFLGIWFGAVVNTSIDGLVAGYLSLACGQFHVLKHSLRNLRPRALKQLGKATEDNESHNISQGTQNEIVLYFNKDAELEKEVYRQMIECVKHHQAIIDFVNKVQNTFNGSMFSQFVSSMLVICITAFELSVIKPFSPLFFTIGLYLINMIIQIFFYCWYGNELYLLSQTVTDDVYNSDWIRFEPRTKRLMLIMMERSKKPINLSAGKLFQLSLETFTSIMKSAYSFYAVLNQMEFDIDLDGTDSSF